MNRTPPTFAYSVMAKPGGKVSLPCSASCASLLDIAHAAVAATTTTIALSRTGRSSVSEGLSNSVERTRVIPDRQPRTRQTTERTDLAANAVPALGLGAIERLVRAHEQVFDRRNPGCGKGRHANARRHLQGGPIIEREWVHFDTLPNTLGKRDGDHLPALLKDDQFSRHSARRGRRFALRAATATRGP